mgnify:CR=1 FL=1|jgi:hypothetical protein
MNSEIKPPILKDGYFSILVAELKTGIVLTTEFKRHLGLGKIFWTFENLEKTNKFIESELNKNPDNEFSVRNNKGEYLFTKDINGKR